MKNLGNIMWGIVLILIGLIWGINSLGIAEINVFFRGWWTLFIIVPSIIQIVKRPKDYSSYIFLLIGVVLLLCARDIISYSLIAKLILPACFIIIGINVIFKDLLNKNVQKKIKEIDSDGTEMYVATFSQNKVKLNGDEFNNANLDASFGNIIFDISNCDIKEDRYIKISAIFSGIDVIVPQNTNVKVKSTGIFGGTTNRVKNDNQDGKPTIYIDSLALFGGVDIR